MVKIKILIWCVLSNILPRNIVLQKRHIQPVEKNTSQSLMLYGLAQKLKKYGRICNILPLL